MTIETRRSIYYREGMEAAVVKARSPEYPAIGLGDAIEKVRKVYDRDHLNKISKEVMAAHMGYRSLNGNSLTILSSLSKYGLISGRGNETGVTDLALKILAHEPGVSDRLSALQEAASTPELFAELNSRFQGKASDAGIRGYLLTHKFIPSAADAALRSYRETKELVDAESEAYDRVNPEATLQTEMDEREQQAADEGLDVLNRRGWRTSGHASSAPAETTALRKEVITLDEGDVVITFPDGLSAESVTDLNDHLQLFIRKAQRRAAVEKKDEATH